MSGPSHLVLFQRGKLRWRATVYARRAGELWLHARFTGSRAWVVVNAREAAVAYSKGRLFEVRDMRECARHLRPLSKTWQLTSSQVANSNAQGFRHRDDRP